MKNNNATPSKDTGAQNNNSDNDVDYKNGSKADNSCQTSTSNKTTSKGSR